MFDRFITLPLLLPGRLHAMIVLLLGFSISSFGQVTITQFAVPGNGVNPFGITSGPDGNLWFALNTPPGSAIGGISTTGIGSVFVTPTAFSSPVEITAGPDGNLWFTEGGAGQIGRSTTAGAIAEFSLPGPASCPQGITAGPDGNLWFTESVPRVSLDGAEPAQLRFRLPPSSAHNVASSSPHPLKAMPVQDQQTASTETGPTLGNPDLDLRHQELRPTNVAPPPKHPRTRRRGSGAQRGCLGLLNSGAWLAMSYSGQSAAYPLSSRSVVAVNINRTCLIQTCLSGLLSSVARERNGGWQSNAVYRCDPLR